MQAGELPVLSPDPMPDSDNTPNLSSLHRERRSAVLA